MKKVIALVAAFALLLTPAFAAAEPLFPHVNAYGGFADVPAGEWYSEAVKVCVETGLMNGTPDGFLPKKEITIGEVAMVAARISEALTGQAMAPAEASAPWYQRAIHFLAAQGVTGLETPEGHASRGDFVQIFGAVLPAENLKAINAITALPDTADSTVLSFYNAGILTGKDDYGTFHASGDLSRAEVATMIARITDPSLRKAYSLENKGETPKTESFSKTFLAVDPETTIMTVGEQKIASEDFLMVLLQLVLEEDTSQMQNTGAGLNWDADYGVGDLGAYFKGLTVDKFATAHFFDAQAKALGCTAEEVPEKLSSAAGLATFVQENDLLRAKHILIPTVDLNAPAKTPLSAEEQEQAKTLADSLIALLLEDPTETHFDALMKQHSKDGGLESNPDGYVFTAGEMVPVFEETTRALAIGKASAPTLSEFGYHIVLRLDPALDTNVLGQYRQTAVGKEIGTWLKANPARDTALYTGLDVKGLYLQVLPLLTAAAS